MKRTTDRFLRFKSKPNCFVSQLPLIYKSYQIYKERFYFLKKKKLCDDMPSIFFNEFNMPHKKKLNRNMLSVFKKKKKEY